LKKEDIIVKITLYNQVNTTYKESEFELLANEVSLQNVADVIFSLCNVDPTLFGAGVSPWQFYIDHKIVD
jgi:hypothetical protein